VFNVCIVVSVFRRLISGTIATGGGQTQEKKAPGRIGSTEKGAELPSEELPERLFAGQTRELRVDYFHDAKAREEKTVTFEWGKRQKLEKRFRVTEARSSTTSSPEPSSQDSATSSLSTSERHVDRALAAADSAAG
jgi:hypothetical protein